MASLLCSRAAIADEAGAGFWLPGNFGSFVALPSDAGWSLPVIYYHSSGDAQGDKTFPRGGRLTAGVRADADFVFIAPTYAFATDVAGGQASVGIAAAVGPLKVGVDATLTGANGNTISGGESDSRNGVSDLYPTASLKWNKGVHNYTAYTMLGVPVGTYDAQRLANTGLNHWSFDVGGGYTYFDRKNEFSAALGVTYNFENHATDYQNGLNVHLDWAALHFLKETFHLGVVGYLYDQLTGDSGAGAVLGDFKSQVAGIGPQAGWFVNGGKRTWYVNVKGYYEFGAKNRPEGWNLWLAAAAPLRPAKSH